MLSNIIIKITKFIKNIFKSITYYIPFSSLFLTKIIHLVELVEFKLLFLYKTEMVYLLNKNTKIILNKNSIISKYILNDFEYDEVNFMQQIIGKDDIVFDVGAHIGFYTLQMADLVGENGKVFAYDASVNNYNQLHRNIQLNNFKNIIYKNIAISNEYNTFVKIYENSIKFDAFNSINYGIEKDAISYNIHTTTIDKELIINSISLEKISFIKIDVENWEYFVLQGAYQLIKEQLPIVFMVEFSFLTEQSSQLNKKVYDFMFENNYKWYDYKVANKMLTNLLFDEIKSNCNLFALHSTFFAKYPNIKSI